MREINVLSTFNGMGCIWIALDRLGVKVNKRYSSEIDKYANIVNDVNYPDTIQLGDITKVKAKDLDKIDLLVGGSPCQGFSFAGKQLNFEDPRSKLFFEFVRLLKECREKNPNVTFLLENVKMKKEYQDIISSYLGVEPVEINSALVSAQNRKRLYWTNIEGIDQPEDKGINLIDILEDGSNNVGRMVGRRINPETGKRDDYNYSIKPLQRIEPRPDNKCGTLTTVDKDNLVISYYLNETELNRAKEKYKAKIWKSGNRMGNMQFPDKTNKKSKCLTSVSIKGARETIHIEDSYGIRTLTRNEKEALQTVPKNYTISVSESQAGKMLGNGWTVNVIVHIFSKMVTE